MNNFAFFTTVINIEDNIAVIYPTNMSISDACGNGDCTRVLELLRAGADINAIYDEPGQQLLHIAVIAGNIKMITLLIKHGANINGVNCYGKTPLYYSICYAATTQHNTPSTTIFEFLLSAGADIDKQHITTGNTILHTLTMYPWHIDYVRILLNHGADAEIKNKDGQTTLDLAKDDEKITLLQEYIASRYAKNAGRRK